MLVQYISTRHSSCIIEKNDSDDDDDDYLH